MANASEKDDVTMGVQQCGLLLQATAGGRAGTSRSKQELNLGAKKGDSQENS